MLEINNLSITAGDFIMNDVHLSVEEGEFYLIMGPTGAGKSLLLESIAGIIPLEQGQVKMRGEDVTDLPAEKRKISILYQDYALFPHLTVMENIRYGLRYQKNLPDEHEHYLEHLLTELKLNRLKDRYPLHLSGGEQQRTALARALAVKPELLLLDEPLSALDPPFRTEIRNLLKTIQAETGITTVMVSHDLNDALTLARRMSVINDGKIIQEGPVEEIFRQPGSPFIASFVGISNVIPVLFKGTSAYAGDLEIITTSAPAQETGHVAIRPEDIVLSRDRLTSSMRNCFKVQVTSVRNHGFYEEVMCQAEGTLFRVHVSPSAMADLDVVVGKDLYLSFKATAVHAF